jgi:hypothetical protein
MAAHRRNILLLVAALVLLGGCVRDYEAMVARDPANRSCVTADSICSHGRH